MDTNAYIRQLEIENALLKEQNASLRARVAQLEKIVAEQAEQIAILQKQNADLMRRLSMNSRNSSKPPSSDPPGMVAPPKAKPASKRGARFGHEPHPRSLVPPEDVTRRVEVSPAECVCGCRDLEMTDDEPLRHQIVDIPPIKPVVVEFIQRSYRCRKCGRIIYQPLPAEIKRCSFGPGVLAIVGALTGAINTSKRKALSFINDVFHVPMSLGGLSACEREMSKALAKPHQQTLDHVRRQPKSHADETGWPRGNRKKGWLWTLCCSSAAGFKIMASRGQDAARELLGAFNGTLTSDRWNGYNFYEGSRQLCWAHLKRDFQGLSEASGPMGKIGRGLSALTKKILHMHSRVRDGTLKRTTFQRRMKPLMRSVEAILKRTADSGLPLSGQCRRIHNQRQYLWTFVEDERVEPTNNLAERVVRQGVLWRKGSLGTQSERGARYAERILTVCATLRLQGRGIINYLRDACRSHLKGEAAPSLVSGC